MRSEEELLAEARAASQATNLSGVVHSFSRAVTDLWALARERGCGTLWVNEHPVSVLYIDAMVLIAGYDQAAVDRASDYRPATAVEELGDAVARGSK